MGIITKELYKINIVFSDMVNLGLERRGFTKENFLKITDFDQIWKKVNGYRCLEE